MQTENPKKLRVGPVILLIIGLTAIAASAWFTLQSGRGKPPHLEGASLLPAPRPVEDFQLIDHNNQPLRASYLHGRWTFAFFGYTNCPDICPNTLTVLNHVQRILAERPAGEEMPQFLFISVDPERDTPETLKGFIRYFNESFLAATGTIEQLTRLNQQLGMMFVRAEGTGDDYAVNHSTSILLFSPAGELVAKFPGWAQTPEQIADNFQKIRDYYGG